MKIKPWMYTHSTSFCLPDRSRRSACMYSKRDSIKIHIGLSGFLCGLCVPHLGDTGCQCQFQSVTCQAESIFTPLVDTCKTPAVHAHQFSSDRHPRLSVSLPSFTIFRSLYLFLLHVPVEKGQISHGGGDSFLTASP